jgi:hypothetical protein
LSGPINLTEVDFDQIKDNLIAYLKSTKQFTDYDFAGSNLQVILNLISYQAQLNAYSTNMIANESFLESSTIRKNVVANARTLGYVPTSVRSASSIISFRFKLPVSNYPSGYPQFVEIRPGMAFTTNTGKESYTFNIIDTQIAAVSNDGLVSFMNVPIYEGTYLEQKFIVDKSIYNQKFILENPEVDTTTLRVEVQENPNEEITSFYRLADNLVELTEESRVYWLEEVDRKYYELTFGDGFFGKRLENDIKLFVNYVVSNGELANGIKEKNNFVFIGNVFDSDSRRVVVRPSILDVSTTMGGAVIESESSIKFRAPREYSAQSRCVVSEDYESLVRRVFPAVDDIYVFGGETLEIPEFGRVYVAIKPSTGEKLSNVTKNYIKKSLDPYRVASLDIILVDPEILYIELDSTVYYDEKKTLKDTSAITTTVRESLSRYVESTSIPKFGGSVKYSKVVGIIDDSDKSITRNNTEMVMRKDFSILVSQPATYEICFSQEILTDNKTSVVYSTGFGLELNGIVDPRVFFFENDPSKIREKSESDSSLVSEIYAFYFNKINEKIKVNFYVNKFNQLIIVDVLGDDKEIIPFGMLDINRGEVTLGYQFKNGIKFVSTQENDNIIKVRAKPKNQDIFAVESVFLSLDVDSSDISSVVDSRIGK